MLKLLVDPKLISRLMHELRRAGRREIGGVLVGECLGNDVFRLMDFSVQRSGGTRACFIRDPDFHRPFIDEFFDKTGHDYMRFNYLGEWHSHPSFSVSPSGTDIKTMLGIVNDPEQNSPFAVLMICRLESSVRIEVGATAYKMGCRPELARLVVSGSVPKRGFLRQST